MGHQILTLSEGDATLLLHRLHAARWPDVEVKYRRNWMDAISYAKTLSVNSEKPAAVVLNAETDDEDRLQSIRSEFEDLVAPLPHSIAPVLILPSPSIERAAPQEILRLLKAFLTDGALSEYRYAPRP